MLSWKGGVAMFNKRAFLVLMLTATLAGSASAALATDGSITRQAANRLIVVTHSPEAGGRMMSGLLFAEGRLLNVFRAVNGFGMVDFGTRGTVYHTDGIQDGPDSTDPLGVKESGSRKNGPAPANTPAP